MNNQLRFVKYIPHYIVKLGFAGGIPIFSYFALKHRLWILTINVLSKNIESIKIFTVEKKNTCILYGHVFVMKTIIGINYIRSKHYATDLPNRSLVVLYL